jgi:WD40 repeat protein
VRLLDGRVLVVGCCGGGSDAAVELATSAELYDPHTGTWSATGSLARGLRGNTEGRATLLHDGRVLALVNGDADGEVGAEVYDPASGTWTVTGQMVRGANGVGDTAVVLQDGRVLVAGGNGAQLYDPITGAWIATGKMTIPRDYTAAALLPDGKVLAAGGEVGGYGGPDVTELYDPNTGSWIAIASPRVGLTANTAVLLRDGDVLVAGKDSQLEVYDAATGTWMEPVEGPAFDMRTATLLSDGTVLGAREAHISCSAAALYDPPAGSWTTAASMLRCRVGSPFTLLLDGTVLVAGGSDCNESVCVPTGSAELYVPAGVRPPALPAFPSPSPPVFPSPTPEPTPFPPAAGPVPPHARSWKVTVDNRSSDSVSLSVAAADGTGPLHVVGSATPNVVPAGATVKVTFLFPVNGGRADGWICVNLRPGAGAGLIEAADIGIPGKILIREDGESGWLSP